MILSSEDRELFYLLYDSITLYANDRLGISDHMFYGDPQMVDEYEQTKVAMELWKAPSIIDEYAMSDDAESLMPDELAQLRDWDKALEGTFAVSVQPDGRALFLADGCVFEVCGIAREIGELLGHGPSFVNTALLPFAGKIVYGGYLDQVPAGLDGRTDAFLALQVQQALASGAVISTDADFIRASRSIAEARVQREVDNMLEDLDALGDETPVQGTHRGALAGLSADDRARAVKEHGHGTAVSAESEAVISDAVQSAFLHERPVEDLRSLLLTQTKEELEWLARAWRLTGVSSLAKAKLADRLVGVMQSDAATLKRYLSHASARQVRTLRTVSEAGGRVDTPIGEGGVVALFEEMPLFFEPVAYAFSYQGTASSVIPVELRPLLEKLDWDAVVSDADRRQGIVDFAGSLAELRGIVEMDEAYDEYERLFPDDGRTDYESFKAVLEGQASGGHQGYELLESGDVYYIIFYDLADEYADAMRRMGGYRESLGDRAYLHGPLSPLLDAILENRRGKVARPMDADLAKPDGVLAWELEQPPVAALRRFFDANVPDGGDDYAFADGVVDGISTMAHGGYGPQEYLNALQDRGFVVDKEHAKRFMQLAQNAIAAVPNWFNNGWSQVEMHEMATGLKTFYNEDGSPMRVGGNDPCPCGSGKKYRECHGRPRSPHAG